MLTRNTFFVSATVLIASSIVSCKKTEDPKCPAGSGGDVTIVAYPQHHGKAVRPYKVFVKYAAQDAPAMGAYDLTKDADTTEDHIEIPGMKCGDYYIYMTGYDTAIKQLVTGGIPYTMQESASGEVSVLVPVTE